LTSLRLINGDGAGWVKSFYRETMSVCYLQLDPYHRNKALTVAGLREYEHSNMLTLLRNKDIKSCLDYIQAIMVNETSENKKKKLLDLYEYYRSNREYLIPIMERGLKLPNPPDGVEYRGLGTMESSVGNLAARRMKGRKAAFSRDGAVRLASLIGYKLSKDLHGKIQHIQTGEIPAKHLEQTFNSMKTLSAGAIAEVIGSGYLPKASSFPSGQLSDITKEVISAIKNKGTPI
jgi:hypothetical protein